MEAIACDEIVEDLVARPALPWPLGVESLACGHFPEALGRNNETLDGEAGFQRRERT